MKWQKYLGDLNNSKKRNNVAAMARKRIGKKRAEQNEMSQTIVFLYTRTYGIKIRAINPTPFAYSIYALCT